MKLVRASRLQFVVAILWVAAIAGAAETADPHLQRGNDLASQKNWDAAIAEYREALRLNPGFALAHYNLGDALRLGGDRAAAASEFRDFLRLAPQNTQFNERMERARNILAELEK